MFYTRLYEAHIPSPLPTFQSFISPFLCLLPRPPKPLKPLSSLPLSRNHNFLFLSLENLNLHILSIYISRKRKKIREEKRRDRSIGRNLNEKNGSESGEGRDGVQGPRNSNALRQQLRRHRQSLHQQHVPEVLQRLLSHHHSNLIFGCDFEVFRREKSEI